VIRAAREQTVQKRAASESRSSPRRRQPLSILLTVHHPLDVDAGAPGATHHLAVEYRALGHRVEVLSFDDLPPFLSEKAKAVLFPFFVAATARRLQRRGELDVLDASTGDAWLFAVTTRRRRCLLVARSHGLEHVAHAERLHEARLGHVRLSWKYPLYHGGILLRLVAMSIRRSDLVLVLNGRDRDFVRDELGADARRVRVVAHGLPETLIGLPWRPTPLEPGSELRIAQLGSYDARKGVQYAVPALHEVLQRFPHVSVSFLGTGCPPARVHADFRPDLRARIRVVPRYRRRDLPALVADHHIKLFPPPSEGFGLALLEAMACGLAPVVSATPGPLELVEHGRDALVVPSRDATALAEALAALVEDRALLDRLRRNAHATAQRFTWPRAAVETLAAYRELAPAGILGG
jgi:glycosyltransferase involved in cell wall biosynthesis